MQHMKTYGKFLKDLNKIIYFYNHISGRIYFRKI